MSQVAQGQLSAEEAEAMIRAYEAGADLPAEVAEPARQSTVSTDSDIASLMASIEQGLTGGQHGNVQQAVVSLIEQRRQGRARDT